MLRYVYATEGLGHFKVAFSLLGRPRLGVLFQIFELPLTHHNTVIYWETYSLNVIMLMISLNGTKVTSVRERYFFYRDIDMDYEYCNTI